MARWTRFAVAKQARAAAKSKSKRPPQGTTIRFTRSETSSVSFAITQSEPGRRSGKHCVAPTKTLKQTSHCARTIARGSFTHSEPRGAARVAFTGRLSHDALKPGSYTPTLTPTDTVHNRGRAHAARFTIAEA